MNIPGIAPMTAILLQPQGMFGHHFHKEGVIYIPQVIV